MLLRVLLVQRRTHHREIGRERQDPCRPRSSTRPCQILAPAVDSPGCGAWWARESGGAARVGAACSRVESRRHDRAHSAGLGALTGGSWPGRAGRHHHRQRSGRREQAGPAHLVDRTRPALRSRRRRGSPPRSSWRGKASRAHPFDPCGPGGFGSGRAVSTPYASGFLSLVTTRIHGGAVPGGVGVAGILESSVE